MTTNYLQDSLWSLSLPHTAALKTKVTHYLGCLNEEMENTSEINMKYN